jgi:hypothetical protein
MRQLNFDIESISDDIHPHRIVATMAHSDPANPIEPDSELTIEKLKEGFSFIKESTALSPNGLHHGVSKTLIKNDEAFKLYPNDYVCHQIW